MVVAVRDHTHGLILDLDLALRPLAISRDGSPFHVHQGLFSKRDRARSRPILKLRYARNRPIAN